MTTRTINPPNDYPPNVRITTVTVTTTNRACRGFVNNKRPFQANNIFARWHDIKDETGAKMNECYAVYSYGWHFPLYVYDRAANAWCENEDSYSVTTSKHRTQTRPTEAKEFIKCSTTMMRDVIRHGFVQALYNRGEGKPTPDPRTYYGYTNY